MPWNEGVKVGSRLSLASYEPLRGMSWLIVEGLKCLELLLHPLDLFGPIKLA